MPRPTSPFAPPSSVVVHAALATGLVSFERGRAPIAWLATEPGAAQTVLSTLAGSMMTVISVVYSILLVALSLASMQFSTRILSGFVRDRASQLVLGLFVGSFVFDLIVLRSVHTDPAPFVPGIALTVAIGLALVTLGSLLYFIHHIIRLIQANYLVDHLASDAEPVIDAVFPEAGPSTAAAPPPPVGAPVHATASGYVQLVDVEGLCARLASLSAPATVQLLRRVGSFVVEGGPLFLVNPPELAATLTPFLRDSVDLGAVRTLQQDAEFGIRLIVDVALKAISPAVNDPSTAATCIDHLGRLLSRAARRGAPPTVFPAGPGLVVVPTTSFADLVDLAVEQLRQYGRTDMAVALRLLRMLHVTAEAARHPARLARIEHHARLIEAAARAAFPADDTEELGRRCAELAATIAAKRAEPILRRDGRAQPGRTGLRPAGGCSGWCP